MRTKRQRLLRNHFAKWFAASCASLLLLTSCGTTRAVFIHDGDLIRIGPNVSGRVYVLKGGEWVLTKETKIPEGWFAGALEPERD